VYRKPKPARSDDEVRPRLGDKDGAEGLSLRSGSPQNVYLLPQRQDFRLERCPRPKQIYHCPNNEPDKIYHPATASPDFRSTASQIEFATVTAKEKLSQGEITAVGPDGRDESDKLIPIEPRGRRPRAARQNGPAPRSSTTVRSC